MNDLASNLNLIICISLIISLTFGIGVFILVYQFYIKPKNINNLKRSKFSDSLLENSMLPKTDETDYPRNGDPVAELKRTRNSEIDFTVEYRTRGNQLIVTVFKVFPCILTEKLFKSQNKSKFYFVVYLDGDSTNSPCESNLKPLQKTIDINEIFIFTVMPYDLSSLELVIHAIHTREKRRYTIGILKFSLWDLDQQVSVVQKSYFLQFPDKKLILPNFLLCLSLKCSKNLIKIKIIRLYMLHCSFLEESDVGLSLRLTLASASKSPLIFDSTTKKCKTSLMFNETKIFETNDVAKEDLALKIQLLECCRINDSNVNSVCGTFTMSTGFFEKSDLDPLWAKVLHNMDTDVIHWYPIFYKKTKK